jgi:branched-chain amino acid transport system ATP-binding protein
MSDLPVVTNPDIPAVRPKRKGLEREFALLRAENLVKDFGGLRAVDGFSLTVGPNDLIGLIGPNGAGKTTVFNLLTGLETLTSGEVRFNNYDLTGRPAYQISHCGLARTFQNIRLLRNLSVLENVKIAYHQHVNYGLLDAMVRTPRFRREEREIERKSLEFLSIFGLGALAHQKASSLPYGLQRKLEIARALATESRLLLLDEPAAGMNPRETAELMTLIHEIKERFELAILLIEHDMKLVMNICERVVVLDAGRVIASGTPEEIRRNPAVIEAYLGKEIEV